MIRGINGQIGDLEREEAALGWEDESLGRVVAKTLLEPI